MAKKKIVSRVLPLIKKNVKEVEYSELEAGEAFIYCGKLCIKVEISNQEAICVDNGGDYWDEMCGQMVIPVDIKITWKEKK